MGFDSNISVNVALESAPVSQTEFNNIMIAGVATAYGATEYIRSYETQAGVTADAADLGVTLTAMATAAFSQDATPNKVYVGDVKALAYNIGLDAILAEDDSWYGYALESRLDADIILSAAWAEANKKLYFAQSNDAVILTAATTDEFSVLKAAGNYRTVGIYALDTEFVDVAWMADKLSINPDEASTVFAYAELVGPVASALSSTEKGYTLGKNVNYYDGFFGKTVMYAGTVANGRYIDEMIIKDWAEARIAEALATQMVSVCNLGLKIPYSDGGIESVAQTVDGILHRGEQLGHFLRNRSIVLRPLLKDISTGDRSARQLTLSGSAVFAGAIQEVTFNLYVTVGV